MRRTRRSIITHRDDLGSGRLARGSCLQPMLGRGGIATEFLHRGPQLDRLLAVEVRAESRDILRTQQRLRHQLGLRRQRKTQVVAVVAGSDARERLGGRAGIRREDANHQPAHALIGIVAEQRREEGPRVRPVR